MLHPTGVAAFEQGHDFPRHERTRGLFLRMSRLPNELFIDPLKDIYHAKKADHWFSSDNARTDIGSCFL
jgi:hypothetical protein